MKLEFKTIIFKILLLVVLSIFVGSAIAFAADESSIWVAREGKIPNSNQHPTNIDVCKVISDPKSTITVDVGTTVGFASSGQQYTMGARGWRIRRKSDDTIVKNQNGVDSNGWPWINNNIWGPFNWSVGVYKFNRTGTYYMDIYNYITNGVVKSATVQINVVNPLVTISIPTANTGLTYDGTNKTGVNAGTGYTLTNASNKNAGTYTAVATLQSGYKWSDNTQTTKSITYTIGKRTINVRADAKSRAEGEANPALTYTYTNVVASDGEAGFTGGLVTDATTSSPAGEYTISIGTLAPADRGTSFKASNYTINFYSAALTITPLNGVQIPKAITGLIYDGTPKTGVRAGVGYTVRNATQTNAGTYTAVASLQEGFRWIDNTTSDKNITFQIEARKLYVKAKSAIKQIFAPNPPLDYAYYNVASSDGEPRFTGSLSTTATGSSLAGTYPITSGTLAIVSNGSSFNASNYEMVYLGGNILILEDDSDIAIHTEVVLDTINPIVGSFNISNPDRGLVILNATGLTDGEGTGIYRVVWTLTAGSETQTLEELFDHFTGNLDAIFQVPEGVSYGASIKVYDQVGNVTTMEAGIQSRINITIKPKDQNIIAGYSIDTSTSQIEIVSGSLRDGDTISAAGTTLVENRTNNTIVLTELRILDGLGNVVPLYTEHVSASYSGTEEQATDAVYDVTILDGSLTVSPKDISVDPIIEGRGTVTLTGGSTFVYNAQFYTPPVTVTYTYRNPTNTSEMITDTLVEGIDYVLLYDNNYNAGTANIYVTGIGNYTGRIITDFTIARRPLQIVPMTLDLQDGDILPTLDYHYITYNNTANYDEYGESGVEIPGFTGVLDTECPNPVVTGEYEITIGTLTIVDNEDGHFLVDNYEIEFVPTEVSFGRPGIIVARKPIESVTIIGGSEFIYDGTPKEPEVLVTSSNGVMTKDIDYEVYYRNNINAYNEDDVSGEVPTIEVIGIGDYSGEYILFFDINPRELNVIAEDKVRIYKEANPELTYVINPGGLVDGEVPTYNISLSTTATVDSVPGGYDIVFSNDSKLSTNGRFLEKNYNVTFTNGILEIKKAKIIDVVISPNEAEYTGTQFVPYVVVYGERFSGDTTGTILTLDEDYTQQFFDNINVNSATNNPRVVVNGNGYYEGSFTRAFSITPANIVGELSIVGTVNLGETLYATLSNVRPDNVNVSYQWYKSASNGLTYETLMDVDKIEGATARTYVLQESDYGYYLYCVAELSKQNYNNKTLSAMANGTMPDVIPPKISITAKVASGGEYISNTWSNEDILLNIRAVDNDKVARIEMKAPGSDTFVTLVSNTEGAQTMAGSVEINTDVNLAEYNFRAVDIHDNVSEITSFKARLDKTPPTIGEITRNYTEWTNQNVELTFRASENAEGSGIVAYYIGNTNIPSNFTPTATTYAFVQQKTHTSNVTGQYFVVKDLAGNVNSIGYEVTNIDKVAPSLTVKYTNYGSHIDAVITTSDKASGVKEVLVNGEVIPLTQTSTTEYTATYIISEPGNYSFVSRDVAGNEKSASRDVYGIRYYPNGAPGTMLQQLKLANKSVLIKECEYINQDFTFINWNTEPDGSGISYLPGAEYNENGVLELHAQWQEIDYSLDRIVLNAYDFAYTGLPVIPQEKVYDVNGKLLELGADYTLTYEDNILPGLAKVTATGMGKYVGDELEANYSINGTSVEELNITLEKDVYVYDGLEKKPKATVTFGARTLASGKDYTITYANNIEVGTATATIKCKGEFYGEATKQFLIVRADRKLDVYNVALVVGESQVLTYSYTGENANDTLTVSNNAIATVSKNTEDSLFTITGVSAGKSTMEYNVPMTRNYNGVVATLQVTVFENEEQTNPIYGTILINDDDEFTNTPRVLLSINASKADYMYLSTTNTKPSADASGWVEYSSKMPYVFTSDAGEKVIYAWFKDKKGNVSNVAEDTIILKYDYEFPAHDQIMLDKTEINNTAPSVELIKYQNEGIDVRSIFNQSDIVVNKTRSGVDYSTIEYGIKQGDSANFTWGSENLYNHLAYGQKYTFVTRAYDRAGNGVTISEETVVNMPLKQGTIITLTNKVEQVDGKTHDIDPATFETIEGRPITGQVTYKYYIDDECRDGYETTPTRDGSLTVGGAPSKPGTYYVKCFLKDDENYFDTESNIAELRIGWYISKDGGKGIFAYIDETSTNSNQYELNVIGSGDMGDLRDIVARNTNESYTYWVDYKDSIVGLNIGTTEKDSINNIGADVFSGLTKITEIVLPDTIRSIGSNAFRGDSSVNTKVTIPATVTTIGEINPFAGTRVSSFEVIYGNTNYRAVDGTLVSFNRKDLVAYPSGKSDTTYEIPDGIENILPHAFEDSDNLEIVKISNGVKTIKDRAFYDCSNLRQIEIYDYFKREDKKIDIESIGGDAFKNIKNNSSIYTFDKKIADLIKEDEHYNPSTTTVYWPPKITLDPTDMSVSQGNSVKFISEAEDGYRTGINYQWFVIHEDENATPISGTIDATYDTPTGLTSENSGDRYFVGVWNMEFYHEFFTKVQEDKTYETSRLFSNQAVLTVLQDSYYVVEKHSNGNFYYFDVLQDAFNFAVTKDKIRVLKDVPDEKNAKLSVDKDIELILDHSINMTGTISVKRSETANGRLVVSGSKNITKNKDNIFEVDGTLVLKTSGKFTSTSGTIVEAYAKSIVEFESGTMETSATAIKGRDAHISLTSNNARITVNSANEVSGIEMNGNTKVTMSDGTIVVNSTVSTGTVAGILNKAQDNTASKKGRLNITGGTITANV